MLTSEKFIRFYLRKQLTLSKKLGNTFPLSIRTITSHIQHDPSMINPREFWGKEATKIAWAHPPNEILTATKDPFYDWFKGGYLNTSYNILERNIALGRGNNRAIIFHSAVTNIQRYITYNELLQRVQQTAKLLINSGVTKGDRVLLYMPMIEEAIITMLACSRLGAIHSVVFGGFASHELQVRIEDAQPKVIVSSTYGLEGRTKVVDYSTLLQGAIDKSKHKPGTVLVYERHDAKEVEALAKAGEQANTNMRNIVTMNSTASSNVRNIVTSNSTPTTNVHYKYWHKEMETIPQDVVVDPVWVESSHPAYIIYTSGSTGAPKGVVRDTGGHVVAMRYSMEEIFKIKTKEVWWAASDIGWVVGHSYCTYAPLITGATTLIFEGKPVGCPDAGTFWKVIQDHKVRGMFTAPTALRAIKKEDSEGKLIKQYDTSSLQVLYVAGERCDPDTLVWTQQLLENRPVVDHYWSTEFGWPILCTPLEEEVVINSNKEKITKLKPAKPILPGSAGLPVPGWDIRVLSPKEVLNSRGSEEEYYSNVANAVTSDTGNIKIRGGRGHYHTQDHDHSHHDNLSHHPWLLEAANNQLGPIVVRLPLPPGALKTLYNDETRYRKGYTDPYPGYFSTGDAGFIDNEGYYHVMGRVDDVINVAGHRLSTGTMEAVISSHSSVAEVAVIGPNDELKGQIALALIVVKASNTLSMKEITDAAVQLVRDQIGPVAAFRHAIIVQRLPKTRSGKILRATLKAIADGTPYKVPATIDDPAILDEITIELRKAGFGSNKTNH